MLLDRTRHQITFRRDGHQPVDLAYAAAQLCQSRQSKKCLIDRAQNPPCQHHGCHQRTDAHLRIHHALRTKRQNKRTGRNHQNLCGCVDHVIDHGNAITGIGSISRYIAETRKPAFFRCGVFQGRHLADRFHKKLLSACTMPAQLGHAARDNRKCHDTDQGEHPDQGNRDQGKPAAKIEHDNQEKRDERNFHNHQSHRPGEKFAHAFKIANT